MGFFDRFSAKKPDSRPASVPSGNAMPTNGATHHPAATPSAPAAAAPSTGAAPASASAAEKSAAAGGILPQLAAAREKLKAKDLPAALSIYEGVLAVAADRSDVLMTISADLGTNGYVQEIIELLAPRYDVQKHGVAAGLNLLQAYIVTRQAEAAQHLLDLLFSLQRPELEGRLVGFSNAVSELFLSEVEGERTSAAAPATPTSGPAPEARPTVSLVSISKPIWSYGLEERAPGLLPRKEGKLRRVAFAQVSLPGVADAVARGAQPEDTTGRFCRGLPLWFAETFAASAGYESVAAVAISTAKNYMLFPIEWTAENIRQLNDSVQGGLDYVLTGALRNRNDDYELTLRIWEVKKFRELKAFSTRWNPSTADAELAKFHTLVRTYMEWTALPAGNGLAYAAPAAPVAHVQALGATLTGFLVEKGVLAPEQALPASDVLLRNAQANAADARAHLALVASLARAEQLGHAIEPAAQAHAEAWLASDAARAAGVA